MTETTGQSLAVALGAVVFAGLLSPWPVSYTHLTLPTSDLV